MKRREQRLQAILELVVVSPAGRLDEGTIAGYVSENCEISVGTVYRDLEELHARGWIARMYGRVYLTRKGVRLLNERHAAQAILEVDAQEVEDRGPAVE